MTEWALKFYNDIPPLNRKIIQEADNLIDKKVGTGVCIEFIWEVLNNNGLEVPSKRKENLAWNDTHSRDVTDSIIYPGDIIIYNNHIAIIYAEMDSLKYRIIHQNFSGKLKYSHVGFGTVNLEEVDLPMIYRITL